MTANTVTLLLAFLSLGFFLKNLGRSSFKLDQELPENAPFIQTENNVFWLNSLIRLDRRLDLSFSIFLIMLFAHAASVIVTDPTTMYQIIITF